MKNHRKKQTYRNKINLKPGNTIFATMYIHNRSVTTLTLATGNGVHGFVMDEEGGLNILKEYGGFLTI